MNATDNRFFEEYKRLEALCNDMFGTNRGISEYLFQMDEAAARGSLLVKSWYDDYELARRLRRLRNRLAHEQSGDGVCTKKDLEELASFYDRLLKGEDAFAQLRRIDAAEADRNHAGTNTGNGRKRKGNALAWVVFCLILLLAVLIVTIVK